MTDDTLPMPDIEDGPPWLVNRDDDVQIEFPSKPSESVPEPALVRGALVALVGLLGGIAGHQIDVSWIDPVMNLYIVVGPLALAWWIRRNVSPTRRHKA